MTTNQTTTTPPVSLAADDPRALFARAVATAGAVIGSVRPEQLDDPTPCTDMTVRQLVTHLVSVLDRVAVMGEGGDPFSVPATEADDDGWLAAWTGAAHRVQAAWTDDAVLDRPMDLPWQQGRGRDILRGYLSELTVHTWDLATATGQSPTWDDDVVAAALDGPELLPATGRMELFEQISHAMGMDEVAVPFADAVEVDADAPAIDRLVAWNGRDPRR